ncbi:MAG: TRAP transporter large permease subunit [Betaproteobacteria bacterium]|nr:TRAP transporter large permease subunit [Betaproteobacteria bacterium]
MTVGLVSLGVVIACIAGIFLSTEQITNGHIGLLMLGLIVVAIMLGFPTAFTLMGLGMIFGFYSFYKPGQPIFENSILDLMVQRTYGVMTNDVLISIPLFVFMGYIIERANIIDKLFRSMQLAMKHVPGSLAVATIITCAAFATATGIVGAVVTLMGLLALPAMLRAGYDVKLSAGAITAGGCLGILIPPSVMLILYGATAGVSVVKLYAGAFLPGVGLAVLYVVYVIIRAIINPRVAPKLPSEESDVPFFQVVGMLLTSFFPLTVLILGVLGSIVFGLATPSEAAAIGSLGGFLLAIGYRQLTWQRLKESIFLTARTSAMVCWLFVGSALFSAVFALLGGQEIINNWVLSLGLTKIQFLLLSQIIIFLLGWPLEWTEIIVIFMPIFIPLIAHFEIDPLFFGILVALNLQTAFLSPPVAMAAFYLKGVAPLHVTLNQIFAGMMPFMAIQVLAMFLLYVWPEIALWLPNYLYR